MAKYQQGFFKPLHPEKYKGKKDIVFRSGWERNFMLWADQHKDVIRWSSEEVILQYRHPVTNRLHRYFPDFWIEKLDRNGNLETLLIEIKPLAQCKPPVLKNCKNGKPRKNQVHQIITYGVNQAKWKAAQAYCDKMKWKFQVLTEKDLNLL